jgi:hypothetical protein
MAARRDVTAVADPSTNLVFSAATGTNQLFGVSATTGLATMRYQLDLTSPEHFPMPGLGDNRVFIESGDTVKAFPTGAARRINARRWSARRRRAAASPRRRPNPPCARRCKRVRVRASRAG